MPRRSPSTRNAWSAACSGVTRNARQSSATARYRGSTASVSHTPFAERVKGTPSATIAAASTRRITGRPRLLPTVRAVATSGLRCTAWRFAAGPRCGWRGGTADRAVEELVGRRRRPVAERDRNAVPLARPDPGAGSVEGEPPLLVRGHDVVELGSGQPQGRQQVVDVHPPGLVHGQPDALGDDAARRTAACSPGRRPRRNPRGSKAPQEVQCRRQRPIKDRRSGTPARRDAEAPLRGGPPCSTSRNGCSSAPAAQ